MSSTELVVLSATEGTGSGAAHRKETGMIKPENPYTKYLQNDRNGKKISVLWSVFEGDWADLTIPQIADVLNVAPSYISRCIYRIKRDTGYIVPYVKRKAGWKPDE